jgi:hypothetical protein
LLLVLASAGQAALEWVDLAAPLERRASDPRHHVAAASRAAALDLILKGSKAARRGQLEGGPTGMISASFGRSKRAYVLA